MIQGIKGRKKIEILAPVGSYESFKAAVTAGADAVYAGGPRFGARAFADNFTDEQLLEAIDYAHLHGRKFYLTVNTLLKDEEMEMLHGYLEPLYRQGLDAVIVQDIGVLAFVRAHFPEMDIHASTQMTIANTEGALFLKEHGAVRVVPARELALEEVRDIAKRTGLELECFVHGALCYCYSGQCLLSSLIGGRSGNRGQCAQPCRLPYTVNGKKEYALSLKDICTLELIPEMVDAGIDSFKIEGRMKKPEYVALVTAMYRKYTDMYLQNGRKGFSVSARDIEMLMDIYNRGGFSQGYYKQHNGREMLSIGRPNHAGVPAVRVTAQRGREVSGEALTDIHKGDILELGDETGRDNANTRPNGIGGRSSGASGDPGYQKWYTFGTAVPAGGRVQILIPKGMSLKKGTVLSRIRNQELLDTIQKRYTDGILQERITGRFRTAVQKPAVLTLEYRGITVTAETEELTEAAKSQPLDQERIKKQLRKTGNTEFVFEELDVITDGPVFLPMQRLNELRRSALELLTEAAVKTYRRNCCVPEIQHKNTVWKETAVRQEEKKSPYLSVLVETEEQTAEAITCPEVFRIYLDSSSGTDFIGKGTYIEICREAKAEGKEIYLAMPHIFRQKAVSYFKENQESLAAFDGFLLRNYESFHFLREHGFDKKVILDHNLYVFNQSAKQFWDSCGVQAFTAPVELNKAELERLMIERAELPVYGRLPVMVSAQCVEKTTSGCTKTPGITVVKDRYQKDFPVNRCCRFCYNVMYHTEPLFLLDLKEEICGLSPAGIRLMFTQESGLETRRILDMYREIYCGGRQVRMDDPDCTRGHFKRGIT